jgi:uncharacterized protein YceK
MNTKIFLSTIVVAVGLSGCATLFGPDSQTVNVRASNNKMIQGRLTDGTPVKIPGTVVIEKTDSNPVQIFVDKRSCSPVTNVNRTFESAFWGNIIIGGLLGSGTDYISGKMWSYEPNVTVVCRG